MLDYGLIEGPVVVTGAAGFLGKVVIDDLVARGVRDIRAVDLTAAPGHASQSGTTYFQRDLRTDRLEEPFAGARTVLHLAACQYHTPVAPSTYELPFFAINVDGTRRALAAAKSGGARHFVFVSTNMVYGRPRTLPLTEAHPRDPFGPYGKSKLEAEALVEAAQSDSLDCAIVRPGLIVGPGRTGVIEQVFRWIRAGTPIAVIGNANNRYEVIHVTDVAQLVIAAATHRGFAAFNCASVSVPTMREWIEAVKREADSHARIVGIPGRLVKPVLALLEKLHLAPLRKDQYLIADVDYFMDASFAQRALGWTPKYSGLDAILDTYRVYAQTHGAA